MSKKVLVVDDDPDVRLFNSTVVEECGHTPVEAVNGEEALALLKKEKPDLVILDVMMPRQTGLRLYRELKTNRAYRGIAVIMLSGISPKVFLRSNQAMSEFGGSKVPEPEIYLEKPVEGEVLADTIRRILG